MKKIIVLAFVSILAFRSVSLGGEAPTQVKEVVVAAVKSGLLSAVDFSTTVLTPDELAAFRKDIPKHNWIAEIPGLEAVLLSNFPAEVGVHKKSGFRVAVHYSPEKLMLLSCSLPLVNGGPKEQKEMIETMLSTAEALVGRETGIRQWLDAEWKRAWEISAQLFEKQAVDPKEQIRKKEFGSFLVTVWGVVPDIVFFNCVRKG